MSFGDFQEAVLIVSADPLAVLLAVTVAGMVLLAMFLVLFAISRSMFNMWRE